MKYEYDSVELLLFFTSTSAQLYLVEVGKY